MTAASGAAPSNRVAAARAQTTGFGTLVFLASDVMLFAGFFAAYYFLRGQSTEWPPPDVSLSVPVTAVATAMLVASSATMQMAVRAFEAGRAQVMQRWLAATVLLGGLFLANQVRDYRSLDFDMSTHAYGSAYWSLTGLHSLHVMTGLFLISLLAVRIGAHPGSAAGAVSSTAYFWHLVDVVWIAVFVTIWVVR